MSDFMKWLYSSYIRPQIDNTPKEDYTFHLDVVRNCLPPAVQQDLEKVLEFQSIQSFALGLRTGKGLADSFTA